MYGYYGYGYVSAMEIIRPNGDVVSQWETTGGNHYSQINENITQPTISGTSTYNYAYWPNDNKIDQYAMSNLSIDFVSISKIKLWSLINDDAIGEGGKSVECRVNIKINGSWQTEQVITKDGSGNWSWENVEWNGNWTKSNVDNVEVMIKSQTLMSKGHEIDIANLYLEIHGLKETITFFDL